MWAGDLGNSNVGAPDVGAGAWGAQTWERLMSEFRLQAEVPRGLQPAHVSLLGQDQVCFPSAFCAQTLFLIRPHLSAYLCCLHALF